MRISVLTVSIIFFLSACAKNPYGNGMNLYEKHCANCHGRDGIGLQELIPPLRKSNFLMKNRDLLPCIIRYGLDSAITVNGKVYDFQKMPRNDQLSDIEITNIMNFILNAWGNKAPYVYLDSVKVRLQNCDTTRIARPDLK